MRIAFNYKGGCKTYSALGNNYARIAVGSDGSVSSSSISIVNQSSTNLATNYKTLFNDPVYLNTTAVKGSGAYLVELDLNKCTTINNNLSTYTYYMKAIDRTTNENIIQQGTSINLPSPGEYEIHMIAKKSNGQFQVSPYLDLYSKSSTASSYPASTGQYLQLTGDLTPPDMGTTTSFLTREYSTPNALILMYRGGYSFGYPIDTSSSLDNTITYYILPFSITYCTESELAAYPQKTVKFNTDQTSWPLPHDSSARQGIIELPYGDLDEGSYRVCVIAKDKYENKAISFIPVVNKLYNQKLNCSYSPSSSKITTDGSNGSYSAFYYYDTNRSRWVFYKNCDYNPDGFTVSTSDLVNKWVRVTGGKSSEPPEGAYYDVEYVYIGSSVTCNNKNIMELQNGLQVFCDQSTFAHTLYSTKKLTETNTAADITKWENKGTETGIKISTTNFTYGTENLSGVPSGCYYTTVVHFRDGTKLMTEVKQK